MAESLELKTPGRKGGGQRVDVSNVKGVGVEGHKVQTKTKAWLTDNTVLDIAQEGGEGSLIVQHCNEG
jgi:hypothetical protein